MIDFLSKIATDSRKIHCAHGLASPKAFVTTGGDGENKMVVRQLSSPAMLPEVTV